MTAPTGTAGLEAALRGRLPADALLASPAEFVVDDHEPAVVVSPASPEEVATALAVANEAGAALIAWGGGAHMTLGAPPARYDLALDLQRLNALVEYEAADLTATVQAGMRLGDLNRRLGERGQWLPLDPPGAAVATIGGVLASNASGHARVAFGSARDLLIGITVATASGQLVKAGGRVVKNVAGYDMGKLHIGALGTLGVIVQASFKVQPLPLRSETLVATGDAIEPALGVARQVWDTGLAYSGLAIAKREGEFGWTLAVRLAGGDAAVERSRRDVEALASTAGRSVSEAPTDVWDDLRELCRPAAPAGVVTRASVKPGDAPELATSLAGHGAAVLLYPTLGSVYGRWRDPAAIPAEALRALRDRCEALGGALVVTAAPPALKREVGVWGSSRGDFSLMQRLKQEMDPRGVLSPGRFVGGL